MRCFRAVCVRAFTDACLLPSAAMNIHLSDACALHSARMNIHVAGCGCGGVVQPGVHGAVVRAREAPAADAALERLVAGVAARVRR